MPIYVSIILLVVGMVLLIKGADFFVEGASKIARMLKIPSLVIGLTLVSIGTSAPEFAVSLTASLQGANDLSFGNIVGSNIFNMLFIIGVTGLINPINYNLSYNMDMVILIVATIVLALFPYTDKKDEMTTSNGISYLMLYALYMVILFVK